MQVTAQQWLVYTLTKSALLLGLLGIAQFGPIMCFSLFAGVIIDRYPKKNLLIFTQIGFMLQSLLLALIVWSGHASYWPIFILALISGFLNTLDHPTRQSFVPELVESNDLRSAIGLNSAVFNLARMIGPALATLFMVRYGAGLVFFLNALSFIPVIGCLYFIRVQRRDIIQASNKIHQEVIEGLKYIKQSPVIFSSILCLLVVGTFIMNFNVTIPIYAAEVLKQDVSGYGLLLTAFGGGSLVSALVVASIAKSKPKQRLLFASALIVSLFLMLLQPLQFFSLAVIVMALLGFFTILFMTTVNTTVQLNTTDALRGRVASVYSFAFLGTSPIGNLFAGSIMEKLGAGMGIFVCGAISACLILLIFIRIAIKKHQNTGNG